MEIKGKKQRNYNKKMQIRLCDTFTRRKREKFNISIAILEKLMITQ